MEFLGLVSNNKIKKRQIIKAGSWVLGGHLISQLIRLGGNLILTRLLVPEMFGVMAIVNVLIMGVEMLSDFGIGQGIIQNKRGDDPDFVNTAWTLQIIRGFILWMINCLVAIMLWGLSYLNYLDQQNIYANPLLPYLIIVSGFGVVISGFKSTAIYQANRNLMMGRLTVINVMSQVVSLITIVILAWNYRTIWALVIGGLMFQLIEMWFSHVFLVGVKNKLCWDKIALAELKCFGKWIFLSSALGFIGNQGDRLILGGLLSAQELGVYSIAFMLSNFPSTIVSNLSHKVLFPNFSRINREFPGQLKFSLIKSKLWLGVSVIPITGILMSGSEFIVDLLYDDRYSDAGWMIKLLFLRVVTGCMLIPNALVMVAKGLPQYSTFSATLKALFIFIALPLSHKLYDTQFMIFMIGISGLINLPILWYALIKHKLFSLKVEVFSVICLAIGYIAGDLIFSSLK
ncbi:oligosaccharide flippase family protein [Methylotuvimicrobium sp. KM1]|uniref:oligosaccharide flippase family protein n=1 Tax=Methylotuvimicrobium sp. KM1 TaxID=3377707 RepID=UPI00384CE51E